MPFPSLDELYKKSGITLTPQKTNASGAFTPQSSPLSLSPSSKTKTTTASTIGIPKTSASKSQFPSIEEIQSKAGVTPSQSKALVSSDPEAVRSFLLTPVSSKTAQSTKAIPDASVVSTNDMLKKAFVDTNQVRPAFNTEDEKVEVDGGFLTKAAIGTGTFVAEWLPRIVTKAIVNAKTNIGNVDTGVDIGFNPSRLGIASKDGKALSSGQNYINELEKTGFLQDPSLAKLPSAVWAATKTAAFDILDLLDAGALWKAVNKAIIKNIAVNEAEHVGVWQTLGRPATPEASTKIKNQMLVELSNETNGFQNGGSDTAKKIINADEIIQKQGIPKVPSTGRRVVERTAAVLDANLRDVPGMLKQGLAEDIVAPYAKIKGYLPGNVPENPNAMPLGLSTENVRRVGDNAVTFKQGSSLTDELSQFKTPDEFVGSGKYLFHGTMEDVKGSLRGGGYDSVLWTADKPSIAQNYIPESGMSTYHNWATSSFEKERDIFPISGFEKELYRLAGKDAADVVINKSDYMGRPTSWSGQALTKGEADEALKKIGYTTEDDKIKTVFEDGKEVIKPKDYKSPGAVYVIKKGDLKLFDLSEMELDEQNPIYNNVELFNKLEKQGYDGVIINDIAQTKSGNYGHKSIGLFPSGIEKSEVVGNTPATNFDISESRANVTPDIEALFKQVLTPREFKGFKDITTKVLDRLVGKTTTSKQFIQDLNKNADIKQAEREIIQKVLDTYPDGTKIPVQEFADKVKLELLPLNAKTSDVYKPDASSWHNSDSLIQEGDFTPKYEGISLPKDIRGDVATYREVIYESPIETSAGGVHFNYLTKNYFAHVRFEDMADGITRRLDEIQSDLMQKGRLEGESIDQFEVGYDTALKAFKEGKMVYKLDGNPMTGESELGEKIKSVSELEESLDYAIRNDERNAELAQLEPYRNIWHERIIREQVKQAAKDGKTELLFPTGKTAMMIEKLGQGTGFTFSEPDARRFGINLKESDLKVGMEVIQEGTEKWIITDVLGDGKFKAIPKDIVPKFTYMKSNDKTLVETSGGIRSTKDGVYTKEDWIKEAGRSSRAETFDISDKVDTSNPIYRFYENTVAKYLKNNYGAARVTDAQGVSWFEIPVSESAARKPVVAYRRYIFSKLEGPQISIEEARKLIAKILEESPVSVVFKPHLIEGIATGQYSRVIDSVEGSMKSLITLYEEGGKTSATTALHEAGHYMFNNLLSIPERKMALDIARKEITVAEKIAYKIKGYPKDQVLEEFIVDKYAEAKAKAMGYKGPWAKVFELIDSVLKKISDTWKKVVDIHKKASRRGRNGGYANFFEPLDVNTLKKISEETKPHAITEILEEKYRNLSQRTLDMFSKRLARLKRTDDIQGLVGVIEKMDTEVMENAVTRAYTKEAPPQSSPTAPKTPQTDGAQLIPPGIGELITKSEKSSYINSIQELNALVNREAGYDGLTPKDKVSLAHAEYDAIWDKINARVIVRYEELAIERSILEEAIAQNTARDFIKYFGRENPRSTTLYDLFTAARGTDKKVRDIDSVLEEKGFTDFEHAQEALEHYVDMRDRLKELKQEMRDMLPDVKTARMLKDFLDDVPVLQDLPAISAIDQLANYSDITSTYRDIAGFEKEALDPYRIMKKFFGPRYDIMKKAIMDPFDDSKGAMVDEVEKLGQELKKNVIDKYKIARDSKDAQYVRQLGEGKMSMQDLVNLVGSERANEIAAADSYFRGWYDHLLDEANYTLNKIYPNNPEKQIPKHKNYYHHMREGNALGDTLQALKNLFDTPAGISPELAGKSEMTQPRSKWLSFAQRRIGEKSDTDAITGAIDYINAFAYLKHISPNISKFRYLRRRLADLAPTPGDPAAMGLKKEEGINNFLVFLDNYSNRLAGKSHPLDRWVSDTIPGGRRMMNTITWVNNRVKANTILLKAGSAVAQFANIPVGVASAKQYSYHGMRRSLGSIFGENTPIQESSFIKERNLKSLAEEFKLDWIEHPVKRTIEEGKGFAVWMLRAADSIGTNFIWNSHYEKAIAEAMDDPVRYADMKTREIVAGRGIGEVPLGQESKVFQVLAPFQIEVGNFIWIAKDMVKTRDIGALVLLLVGNYLFNEAAEEVRGSRVVYDPINALIEGTVMLVNEDNKKRGAMKFVGRQVGEILSNVPLGQTVAGQIPDTAVEAVTGLMDAPMTKQDIFGQGDPGRFGSGFLVWKAFEDPIFRFALPFGGLQLKTTWQGVQAYIDGQVEDKKGRLNFTLDRTVTNLVKAVLFGKNAVKEARDYFDEREDLFRVRDSQEAARNEVAIRAEEEWGRIKEIKEDQGSAAAKEYLKKIAVEDEALAKKVLDIGIAEKRGFNGVDRLIQQLGVENGERAKYIVEQLEDFDTSEEKKAYLKDLAEKKLLSEKVIAQIAYLKKNK